MITLLSVILLGFFLGMRHATDVDHVIAVTTIVSRQRSVRSAAWIGAVWGLGHTLTVAVVGGAIILFGLVVPPRLGMSLELGVALMLIALGVWNLRPSHPHPHINSTRPLIVGVMHGLAGSAAVALLVLPIIHNAAWALAYLLVFGLGTIAGMMLVTAAIALPLTKVAARAPVFHRRLGLASGFLSIGFGLFWAYEVFAR